MVATNGYTEKALPWHRRRIVPVSAFNVVTEALDPALMAKVLPNGRPMIENRNSPLWLRPTEDGTRLLFGGTTGEKVGSLKVKAEQLHAEMLRVVPDLEGTRLTHCWSGQVAFPFDFLPHNGFENGIYYAMGWCASGVPMGTYLGHKTALRILGDPDHRTLADRQALPVQAVLQRQSLVPPAHRLLAEARGPQVGTGLNRRSRTGLPDLDHNALYPCQAGGELFRLTRGKSLHHGGDNARPCVLQVREQDRSVHGPGRTGNSSGERP